MHVLKNKNFALLFFGNVVSQMGNIFFSFALAWYVKGLTGDEIQFSVFIAVGVVVQILTLPFSGVIADRFDKVKIVWLTDLIRGIIVLLAGYIIVSTNNFTTIMVSLYTTNIILNFCGGLFGPAASALLPLVVKRENIVSANSLYHGAGSFNNILGVVFAVGVYIKWGIIWIFILNGVSFILSAISEMFIETNEKQEKPNEKLKIKDYFIDIKVGWNYLRKQKGIMMLVVFILPANFVGAAIGNNGYINLFENVLKTSIEPFSYVRIAMAVGGIVMSIILARKNMNLKSGILFKQSLAIFSVFLIVETIFVYLIINSYITLTTFIVLLIVITFLNGLNLTRLNVPIGSSFQKHLDPEMLGRAFSLLGLLSSISMPVGMVLGGVCVKYLGVLNLFIIGSVSMALISLVVLKNQALNTVE